MYIIVLMFQTWEEIVKKLNNPEIKVYDKL